MQSRAMQALAAAAAVFAMVLILRVSGALERMELAAYDLGLRARPAAAVDDDTLDEVSRAVDAAPSDPVPGRHRVALLEQIGLKAVARYERQRYE